MESEIDQDLRTALTIQIFKWVKKKGQLNISPGTIERLEIQEYINSISPLHPNDVPMRADLAVAGAVN